MESLFRKDPPPDRAPTPYELIEPEIVHLQKGYSIRHGARPRSKAPIWLVVIAFGGLAWLYLMDPFYFAWYKGEAIRNYLYLRNYGAGPQLNNLIASQILSADEIDTLNHRPGSFQNYYSSPYAANETADTITTYMASVRALHAGKYKKLDPVGRMRYLLFIRTHLILPTQWSFLNPTVE
jgi:hypothetical protein